MEEIHENTTIDLPHLTGVSFSLSFQFWFTLSFHIPSIICYTFVLIHILLQKTQRQALHNHSILVLLLISFAIVLFDYSLKLDFYYHGEVRIHTAAFCQVWWLFEFGMYTMCTTILAWASFERHILIFYSNSVATKRRRILIHYLPLVSILVYFSIFFIYVILFPPCKNEYDFTISVCGAYPCYLTIQNLALWDTIVHGIIATFLVALFNIALFGRVLWQKRRRLDWRRYKKMAFQLLSISALYLSINFPLMIIFIVQLGGFPNWGVDVQRYFYFLSILLQYLLPFVCLPYLSGIGQTTRILLRRVHRRVIPEMTIRATPVPQHNTRV